MLSIHNIRNQIDQLDNELLTVLSKRFVLVEKIAKLKKANHISIRQNVREKIMLQERLQQAKKLRISSKCVRAIFAAIFQSSRSHQSKTD